MGVTCFTGEHTALARSRRTRRIRDRHTGWPAPAPWDPRRVELLDPPVARRFAIFKHLCSLANVHALQYLKLLRGRILDSNYPSAGCAALGAELPGREAAPCARIRWLLEAGCCSASLLKFERAGGALSPVRL